MKSISDFFNNHPKHFSLLQQKIEETSPKARHKQLLDVCRTHWVSRIDGLDVFNEIFVAVVASLETVKRTEDKCWNAKVRVESQSHFFAIVSLEFIVGLVIVACMLEVTRPLAKQLQSPDIDFIDSIERVTLLFSMLMQIRREIHTFHDGWYAEAVEYIYILLLE